MPSSGATILAEILRELHLSAAIFANIILVTIGAIASYLNRVKNGTTFSLFVFVVNIIIAIVIAFAFSHFWGAALADVSVKYEKGVMIVMGIVSHRLMEVLEYRAGDIFDRIISVIIKK